MSYESLKAEADAIAERCNDRTNRMLEEGKPEEAVDAMTIAQKELRNLKRDIADAEREARAMLQAERTRISSQGRWVGIFLPSKMRRVMSASRGHQRRKVAETQQEVILPYQRLRSAVDDLIAEMDSMKFDIKN